jgi:hypothetical protein
MALPTLDAVFASAADQPRRYMLAQWLAGEKSEVATSAGVLISDAGIASVNGTYVLDGQNEGKNKYSFNGNYIQWDINVWIIFSSEVDESGYVSNDDTEFPWQATWESQAGYEPSPVVTEVPATNPTANYVTLPERYLWAKIAVAAGAPRSEADYISLPKQYVWKAIYDAVSGSSAGTTDWSEKQALGHIAAAYRGDTANPANLATYIDWPWRYQVASIIDHLLGNYNAIIVSGAGSTEINGTYTKRGIYNDKPYYNLFGQPDSIFTSCVMWYGTDWRVINSVDDVFYESFEDVEFPWMVISWNISNGNPPVPTLTPTNV